MPRVTCALFRGRPTTKIIIAPWSGGLPLSRNLLADKGAGSNQALFELILNEIDCLSCGGIFVQTVSLRGAYSGSFPLYAVQVQIPQVGFDEEIEVVGVPRAPSGIEGIAGFRFLNRFTYGNFGDRGQFGFEL